VANGAIETFNIVATGTNVTGDVAFGITATTINVSGTGSLDINAGAEFALVETIDASGLAGDFDVALAARAAASTTKDLTITTGAGSDDVDISLIIDANVDNIIVDLGAGNDRLVLDANTDTGNVIDGGAGTDTLSLDIAMTAVTAAYVSNFEVLQFNMAADVTQDMDLADSMNIVSVLDSIVTADLIITDAANGLVVRLDGTLLSANDAGITAADEDIADVRVTNKTDTANDTLTLEIGGTLGDVNMISLDAATTYETVTVVSSGTSANAIQTIGTAVNNMTFTGATALSLLSTGSLTGVLDAGAMTGAFTTTTSTTALTVNGGAGVDTVTSGLLATGVTQTINGGAGDDILTAGVIVTTGNLVLNGDAGSDTINTAAMDGNTTGPVISTAVVNGGAGIDFITLDAVATVVLADVQSTASLTADGDVVDGFTAAEDDFDYNGTLLNGTNSTVVIGTDTTFATAIANNVAATVFVDSGDLTGTAASTLTTLADSASTEAFTTNAAAFINALIALEGTVAGLDAAIGTGESVLLVFDNGTDSVALKFTNTDTSTANTMIASELEVVAVFDAGVLAAATDII
jgi:hypothetical protein